MSAQPLAGRVALVTGAAGGIGRAAAAALAEAGASLALADVKEPPVPEGALAAAVDVTRRDDVFAMVARTVERFGRLDILVNVAGVVSTGSAVTLEEAEWDRVLDINLKGTFLCCQAAIPAMRANRYGRIVNIGSIVGKNGGNARAWLDKAELDRAGNVAYGVSKAGVHALTHFLAREVASDGITVARSC
jgi:3-oxoacyl-[acyl-carrier protein] reductase